MAFTEGFEISAGIELSTSNFVAQNAAVFTPYSNVISDSIELSEANFVVDSHKVFTAGFVELTDSIEEGEALVTDPNDRVTVFNDGWELYVYTIPLDPGDDSFLIVVGIFVEFSADPTSGTAALSVDFTNTSGGPIEEYYWTFGDGHTSYASEPTHVYENPGTYSVTLRILISGTYYSLTRTDYIHVYPGGLTVGRTNKCYRFAVLEEQGVGPCEISGSDWVFPESRTGVFEIIDEEDQPHLLVLDGNDGKIYDITTRDGPASSNMTKVWKDKVAADGTGGTDYECSLIFPEDRGTYERYFLDHKESHLYVRPLKEGNRDESGYDSNGFPTGIEFDLSIYSDGNPTDATATTEDIPKTGDISFDKRARAHRLNMKATANMADHLITGRQQHYVREDEADSPSNRTMTEDTYQAEFKTPALWPDFYYSNLIDRVTAGSIAAAVTQGTGVDSHSTAMQFSTPITLGSASLGGSGALLLWYKGTIAVTIGGNAVSLTAHGTSGAWTLGYATGLSDSGSVVITPTGAAEVDDLRIFNSAISTGARTYYYNDIVNNSGNIVRPR